MLLELQLDFHKIWTVDKKLFVKRGSVWQYVAYNTTVTEVAYMSYLKPIKDISSPQVQDIGYLL